MPGKLRQVRLDVGFTQVGQLGSAPCRGDLVDLAAALMGVQWLLFVWAPLAGRMLDVSDRKSVV